MFRIAIVEDDSHYQEQLINYLHKFSEESRENIKVDTYFDGDEIVEDYKAQFDVILMDIQMSFMDGMSAAEEIREMDTKVVIMFITNMSQFAIKGYAVNALDYILKPISYFQFSERLEKALDTVKRRNKKESSYITLKVKEGITRLKISDIYFVESQGHNLVFTIKDKEILTSGIMKDLEKQFSEFNFFRAHRGFLVNLQHVEGLEGNDIIIKDKKVPISRRKKSEFMDVLSSYWRSIS